MMKKPRLKKLLSMTLVVLLIAGMATINASATEEDTIKVSLRIEGLEQAIYYNKAIEIPAGASIADLIVALDEIDNAPDVVYNSAWYVEEIDGLAEGDYGGWSGWSFRHNNEELTVGINEVILNDGDEVICYYGDPWGAPGMQYPVVDLSGLFDDGTIMFTSVDTDYDENWEPSLSVNPIAGATVTFNGTTYTTDESGAITITDKTGISGFKTLQIERYDEESGVPTVLRFAPDHKVFVKFADMLDDPWYENAVMFCVSEWSWTGLDLEANLFAPLANMNMAQLIRVLALIAGVDTEVQTNPWYQTELEWAQENEIVTEDEFDADGYITKERFIYMFYLTIMLIGESDMTVREDLTGAVDFDEIDEEYLEAMSWAVASGIVHGIGSGELIIDPQEEFSRAMVCQLLYNYFA